MGGPRNPDAFIEHVKGLPRFDVKVAADTTIHELETSIYGGGGVPDRESQAYLRFLRGVLKFLYKEGREQPRGLADASFVRMRPIVEALVAQDELPPESLDRLAEAEARLSSGG